MVILVRAWSIPVKPEGIYDRFDLAPTENYHLIIFKDSFDCTVQNRVVVSSQTKTLENVYINGSYFILARGV